MKIEGPWGLILEIFGEDLEERLGAWPQSPPPYPAISTIKQSLREHLLQTPIFTKDEKGKIVFYDVQHEWNCPKVDAEQLLDHLVDEVYLFFYSYIDRAFPHRIEDGVTTHQAVAALRKSKSAFIASGTKEKSIEKTIERIMKWDRKSRRHDLKTILQKKIDGKDLIKPLFTIFEGKAPRLSKDGIFYSIAHILKELRLEPGRVDQIFERIKKHSARKKIL